MERAHCEPQNLQDIQHNSGTPSQFGGGPKKWHARLSASWRGSPVLFNAAADDEFEFLDVKGDWVHVQTSGASRGFIRRSSLSCPKSLRNASIRQMRRPKVSV